MSSYTSTLPSLPVELKAHILGYCDQTTLAMTSRASFAFLELSTPLLYEDINIQGPERLLQLISSQVRT